MAIPVLHEVTVWHWVGFVAAVLVFLAMDLSVFHRKAPGVQFKEALTWTCVWFSGAMPIVYSIIAARRIELKPAS